MSHLVAFVAFTTLSVERRDGPVGFPEYDIRRDSGSANREPAADSS
jgi:hypothetical protein